MSSRTTDYVLIQMIATELLESLRKHRPPIADLREEPAELLQRNPGLRDDMIEFLSGIDAAALKDKILAPAAKQAVEQYVAENGGIEWLTK